MPTIYDSLLVLLFAVVLPVTAVFRYRKLARDLADGVAGARLRSYRAILIIQWTLAAAIIALWLWERRPFEDLRLGFHAGWGFLVSVALTVAMGWFLAHQLTSVRTKPEVLERAMASVENVRAIVPHEPRELRWFNGVAVTAGVCEELMFRGCLVWYLAHWMPYVAALAAMCVIFGVGHAYQGPGGALRAGLAGVVTAALMVLSGSLWVPMAFHMVVDLYGGHTAYAVVRAQSVPHAA